ncbi:hypothetical protein B0T21DRAFT_387800 [Apiosordaria backusii]|uniref:5-formyltetrahydrofolate cyclo-ligase n=1 Tax=Apiosordaria backusii TaxID=314023 RepID=A0AA39ZVA0_9PEZI|nr:hypothetical protein B0T21DRAFT_387800 [Apiosordaria backusii]
MPESAVTDEFAMASLNAAKQQLRTAMKHKLQAMSSESVLLQSSTVFNKLKTFQPFVNAKRVSVFLSMPGGEIQTDAIVRHALVSGKEVFVPYLHKNPASSPALPVRVMDMVRLRDLADYESLTPDRWGIPSINPATVHERQRIFGGPDAQHSQSTLLDLILMPGVAFDIDSENGAIRRLGHGKGFYDYFLSRHSSKSAELGQQESPVLLYGLALSEQFLSPSEGAVPVGPFDQPLDGLILGNGEIKRPRAPAAPAAK